MRVPGNPGRRGSGRRAAAESAFTFIELGSVIAIIAIIVSMAVPVLLEQSRKAEHMVAVENLVSAGKAADGLWFSTLASQSCPIVAGAYRDYDPPPELRGRGEYVPVDARYMSVREPETTWVEITVESGKAAAPGPFAGMVGNPRRTKGSGYRIGGIWKGGVRIADGPGAAGGWELMAGKVGVVENRYFWGGGWRENVENQYLTLVTLEVTGGLAHYYTLNVGVTVAGGTFEWDDGAGTPGDSFGDELASEKPDSSSGARPPGRASPAFRPRGGEGRATGTGPR